MDAGTSALQARPPERPRRAPVSARALVEAVHADLRRRLARRAYRYVVLVYLASRLALLAVAVVDGAVQHRGIAQELTNWDGVWYLRLATRGYPHHPPDVQSTLGFLPVYPLVFLALGRALALPLTVSGLLVAGIGGGIATWNVYRLAAAWWDEESARRVALAFVAFPGSVVFSMLYGEGLMLALVTSALLALRERRFIKAGVCVGFAAAIVADAIVAIVALAAVGAYELAQRFSARRSLEVGAGLCCSVVGLGGVGLFLLTWTGSPFAVVHAQRAHWGERINLLALVHQTNRLVVEASMHPFSYHHLNLNLVVGEAGVVFLLVGLYLCWRERTALDLGSLVWTVGISFLMVTTEFVPPNPRLLLTAFPLVAAVAHRLDGRAFVAFVVLSAVFAVDLSGLTYVGIALRP